MTAGLAALTIGRAAYNRIAAHALKCFPEECCGVLVGTRRAGRVHVAHAVTAANVLPKRLRMRHFEIDPAVLFTLQRTLREGRHKRLRERVVGYFHSHPLGVASPSGADLAGAHEVGLVTLIAAPEQRTGRVTMRAFLRLGDGAARRFRPLRLHIEG
ncbi:MAG: M67 family metallopeptidase [Parvibaculum sp.]|uniref:Mov34/MPN/PAD-1 family protein n=1 Tax=Parvibaculum sp. TaxID=2024848 RepID=UPI003C71E686